MKYFTELLESYSRLKKRTLKLLEEAQPDPDAKAKADDYIAKALNARNFVSPTNRIYIENTKAQIWASKKTQEIFTTLFSGATTDVNPATNPEGYNKFLNYFSNNKNVKDSSPEGSQSKVDGSVSDGTGVVQSEEGYPWIEGAALIDENAFNKTVDIICKNDKTKCEEFKLNYWRFLNSGKPGTIAYTISRTRARVKECDDTDDICKSEIKENESTVAKESAGRTIQKALRLLTKQSTLSLEESDWLKKNINISKKNQILVIDRLTGEGILITQERTTTLIDFLKAASQIKVDPSTDKPLNLQGDSKLFLDNAGSIGGANSTVRGFFFEDVTEASIKIDQCKDLEGPELGACEREAAKVFEKYADKKDRVVQALEALIEHYSKDGEVSIDLRNSLDRFLMEIVNGRSEDAIKSFRIFANKIQRLAVIGTRLRGPKGVERSSLDVGFNRKADLKELYNTREDAAKALQAMGLGDLVDKNRIVERPDGKFEIGNSLKFSTSMEEVDLGQAAVSNIKGALDGSICNDPKTLGTFKRKYGDASGATECARAAENQKRFWRENGITNSDLKFMTKEFDQYEEEKKIFEDLPEIQQYLNKNGTVSSRLPREKLLQTFVDHLTKNGSYGGLQQDMVDEIQAILAKSSRRPWPEVAANLAKVAQKRRLENMYQSSDPRERERAVSFVAGLAVFGGGSVDNSMLTVVDGFKGDMYVTDQNRILAPFVDLLKNREAMQNAKIHFNHGSFVFGDKETGRFVINFDGSQSSCIADTDVVKKSSRRFSSQRGTDPEQKRTDASHKLAKIGITLAEIIKKYSETLSNLKD